MPYQTLRVESEAAVGWIVLNRPGRLNAINRQMARELRDVLREFDSSREIRVLVLRGEGRGFSSGGDVQEMGESVVGHRQGEFFRELVEEVHGVIRAIRESPKPIVAAVHGVAAGAGMSLAMACDLRVVAEGTRFLMSFINIGLVADSGSTYFLPRLVGTGRAAELALTGEALDAEELARSGLANRVVPEPELVRRAGDLAGLLARKSSMALAHTKRLLRESWERALGEQLDAEKEAMLELERNSPDFTEGIRAFLAKRGPRFRD